MDFYLWLTLAAAVIYTLATLCMKRSSSAGVGPWRTTVVWNAILAVMALPFWFTGSQDYSWETLFGPLLVSSLFFLGQLFNALAIYKGDVSVVTPIMGTKVVFVSILAIYFLSDETNPLIWIGVILSAAAIFLFRGSTHAEKKRLLPSILLGLLSAFSFGCFDIFMQQSGHSLGFEDVVARTFTFSFLWSLLLIPRFHSSIQQVTKRTWSWLILGGILHSAQAIMLAYVLSNYGQATRVNIIYGSRAFWSIALVWIIGHWFNNFERKQGRKVFIRRLIASGMLGAAILLATSS